MLTCAHANTKLNGSYNHPHTPINAHNLGKITGHLFYINCVYLLVMWEIIVKIQRTNNSKFVNGLSVKFLTQW